MSNRSMLVGDRVSINGRELSPMRATFDENTIATHEVVAAVAGKKLRVVSALLGSAGSNTAIWKSDSTVISPAFPLSADSGYVLPEAPVLGHFETAAGEPLQLELTAAERVAGHLTYLVI